jgi:hypothetical protein
MENSAILVGTPADWYRYDENGNVVSLDEYGNPAQDDALWAAARKTANGRQIDLREDGEIVGVCIGGSAAQACAGLTPEHINGCPDAFRSKLRLFYDMRGEKRKYGSDGDASTLFHVGHNYEDAVARDAIAEINRTYLNPKGLWGFLVNDAGMYRCGRRNEDGALKYPHAIADFDRLIAVYPYGVVPKENVEPSCMYGLEIKTTTKSLLSDEWSITNENEFGIPEKYAVQMCHYMGVNTAVIGFFIAVRHYGERISKPTDILVRYLPRNEETIERILDQEEAFVQDVLNNRRPEVEEDPQLHDRKETFGGFETFVIGQKDITGEDTSDIDALISRLVSVKEEQSKAYAAQKAAKAAKDDADNAYEALACEIYEKLQKMGLSEISYETPDGKRVLSIERYHSTITYDIEKLKKDNPELASRCVKENLTVSDLTAAEKSLLKTDYCLEEKLSGSVNVKTSLVKAKKKKAA